MQQTLSFSLYLIHVPILLMVRYLMPDSDPLVILSIAIPLALILAWGFWFAIEQRFQRLAKWQAGLHSDLQGMIPSVSHPHRSSDIVKR